MLSIKNLRVNFGSVAAVQDLSLEVKIGEIVALVGANGAGKTTTLMAIAGVVRATGGEIQFEGKSTLKMPPDQIVARGISLVPEGRRILCGLTVKENLQLGTTVRINKNEAQLDVENMLEKFPILRKRYDRLAGQLSGGEQQQLAFARALVSAPKILLCDEPSLGLSPIMTDLVFTILSELNEGGLIILLVEQFAARAVEMADRTYVIKRGKITLSGGREKMMASDAFRKAYFGGL